MNALLIVLIRLIFQLLTSVIRIAFMLAALLGRIIGMLLPLLFRWVIAVARWLTRMITRPRSNDHRWPSREPRGGVSTALANITHRPRTKRPMVIYRRLRRAEDLKRGGR